MRRISTLLVTCFCIITSISAQNLTKLGVNGVKLRNFGEIIQNEEIKGYYYFYQLEASGKNSLYQLAVLDENLREINSIEIIKPKWYFLIDGAFNEDAFGFLFYDAKARSTELITFDKTLKETGSLITKVADGLSSSIYTSTMRGMDMGYTLLSAVPHQGFILYTYPKGYKYQVEFYDNSAKMLWSDKAVENKVDVQIADEAFQTEEYIGSLISHKKSLLSNDLDYNLMIHEVKTGKQLFNIPIEDEKFNLSASNIFYEEASHTITIFGEFFELDSKEYKSQGLGFFYKILDMEGHLIRDKFITWQSDIAKVTKVDSKGRIDGKTRVLFHEVFKTADGEMFAIGEQYKKGVSAAGIAASALGGGIAVMQLEIYDMVIFHFGADLSIKEVNFFDKDKSIMTLPQGYSYISAKKLSYLAKIMGAFDYKFSQISKEKNSFVATYIDYDKEKGEKAKNVFGAIVYTPEKTFTTDKIVLNRQSTNYFVRRAKPGYVMVSEYFKKEKKLDVRLEKINF
ncbi:hypothetical protein QNI16_14490 [Cytophagaceae bacterium YF14B1]|uniref:WG repeat-containing protein n=1 Tax=Xanthocytophaga flava TaxID=3048013 RepID=A0AAE3QR74_9BACT|nr:DUF6770 family protein [Xanthocytophaga flavus]MDJ1481705.1 hypothetical protein [Xanthocytophaga flavus]